MKRTKNGEGWIWVGAFGMLQGFGSAAARHWWERDFGLLWWAENHQPWIGIGVGALGLVLVVVGLASSRN